jgi:hypothetical protein
MLVLVSFHFASFHFIVSLQKFQSRSYGCFWGSLAIVDHVRLEYYKLCYNLSHVTHLNHYGMQTILSLNLDQEDRTVVITVSCLVRIIRVDL